MNRRRFLRTLGIGGAALAVGGLAGAAATVDENPFPIGMIHSGVIVMDHGKRMGKTKFEYQTWRTKGVVNPDPPGCVIEDGEKPWTVDGFGYDDDSTYWTCMRHIE